MVYKIHEELLKVNKKKTCERSETDTSVKTYRWQISTRKDAQHVMSLEDGKFIQGNILRTY